MTRVDTNNQPRSVQTTFADTVDATAFVHAQARAATSASDRSFRATITAGEHIIATVHAEGVDISGSVVKQLGDNDGLAKLTVAGIDAKVMAHRSTTRTGALVVAIDADAGQRIILIVNDSEIADSIVGQGRGQIAVTRAELHDTRTPTITCSLPQGIATSEILTRLQAITAGHAIDFHVHHHADVRSGDVPAA